MNLDLWLPRLGVAASLALAVFVTFNLIRWGLKPGGRFPLRLLNSSMALIGLVTFTRLTDNLLQPANQRPGPFLIATTFPIVIFVLFFFALSSWIIRHGQPSSECEQDNAN